MSFTSKPRRAEALLSLFTVKKPPSNSTLFPRRTLMSSLKKRSQRSIALIFHLFFSLASKINLIGQPAFDLDFLFLECQDFDSLKDDIRVWKWPKYFVVSKQAWCSGVIPTALPILKSIFFSFLSFRICYYGWLNWQRVQISVLESKVEDKQFRFVLKAKVH